ncbi:hypothetical protein KI688_007838 [Linnemannia hyalina]|uniref:Uncharacterized protein n=1 Tax=Linnemannia hyalina TaxID=64524 RepID=A0A9P7XIB4_9FUNG|nr:hypothetical protein KI688_007838 [Linnemannia hyalina]
MDPAFGLGVGATNSLAGVGMLSSGGSDISPGLYQSPSPPLSMTIPMSSQMIQPQDLLFDLEPMVVHTPNSVHVAQGYDSDQFASTATVKPTQANNTNNSSSTSSQLRYSPRLQK